MKANDYQLQILLYFMEKFRELRGKSTDKARVISASPKHFVRDYDENTADPDRKESFTDACDRLEEAGFIRTKRLRFSSDVKRLYLMEDRIDEIEAWLTGHSAYISREQEDRLLNGIFSEEREADGFIRCYEKHVRASAEKTDPEHIGDMVKLLSFLNKCSRELYFREASVLCLGDSKKLEERYLNELISLVRETCFSDTQAEVSDTECLKRLHLRSYDGELVLKGGWILKWDHAQWDISSMRGAVSLSSKDMEHLKNISVSCKEVMSIENKTSFMRMSGDDRALFYLGGYASSAQIDFLKRLADQPGLDFHHFGDIDIGGFLIHRNLVKESGIPFSLWHMGIEELSEGRYASGLRPLTESDRRRAQILAEDPLYRETIAYMLENNVKLEQEIVSYYIQ